MLVEIATFGERVRRGNFVPFQDRKNFYGKEEIHRSILVYDNVPRLVDLWIDVDHPTEQILSQLKQTLKDSGLQHEIWWSGGGYHINLQDGWDFTIEDIETGVVAQTIKKYFPYADIQRYRRNQLIRLENTFNRKRGLWKIKLPELLDPEDAAKLASKPPNSPVPSAVFEKVKIFKKEKPTTKTKGKSPEVRDRPFWPPCIRNIWHEGPVRGSRHINALILAQFFRRWNFNQDETLHMLSYWLASDPLPDDELKHVVSEVFKKGYVYGCSSPELQPHCELPCPYRAFSDRTGDLFTYAAVHYKNALDFGKPFGKTGIKVLPGELITILGMPGSYKSLIAQWLGIELGVRTVYVSMDMQPELTMRRYLQMDRNMSKEEVINAIISGELTEQDVPATVIDRDLTVTNLRNVFSEIMTQYRPQLMIIDHIGMITGQTDYGDLMATRSKLLSKMAREYSTVVLAIDHVSRVSQREGQTNMSSGRNSISEGESSVMLAVSKQSKRPDGMDVVDVRTLKTRDAPSFEALLIVNPITLRVKLMEN